MPVTDVQHDLDALTLTLTARFAAPIEQVWDVYADPRKLEKVWGPPEYPATVVDHELAPGGRVTYYMTGPEGDKHYGYWEVDTVDAPRSFTFRDGFADETFAKNPELPESRNSYEFTEDADGTRAVYTSVYASREGLEQVLAMGVVEGATASINQIDGLLAGATPTA